MKIIVTFCNAKGSKENMVLINLEDSSQKWPESISPNKGVTGITQNDKYIFALYQNQVNGIIIFDKKTLTAINEQELPDVKDPHSIVINAKNEVSLVSTGTDSVISYTFDSKKKTLSDQKVIWKPEGTKGDADTHHLNSLYQQGGKLFVSGFGLKSGDLWRTAGNGYIHNITDDTREIDPIYHPHSAIYREGIYYIESSTRKVKKGDKDIYTIKEGYTRGLFVSEDEKIIVVGSSSGRKRSKSTKLVNNFADPGLIEPACNVIILKKMSLLPMYKKTETINFYPKKNEIYDIISLDEVDEKLEVL